MPTRIACKQETTNDSHVQLDRPPLRESQMTSNTSRTELTQPRARPPSIKKHVIQCKSHSAAGSPARRVPRAISSPARRNDTRRSPPPPSVVGAAHDSPAKQCLRSPVRKPSANHSESSTTKYRMASETGTLSYAQTSLSITHRQSPPQPQPQDMAKSSPLKNPPRRRLQSNPILLPLVPSDQTCLAARSPLKQRPARQTARSPRKDFSRSTVVSNLSASVDELSLPMNDVSVEPSLDISCLVSTKPRTPRKATEQRRKTRLFSSPEVRCDMTPSQSKDGSEEDVDELAIACCTPQRTPQPIHHAISPPMMEQLMDDVDLWTPSVPYTFDKSFSDLSIDATECQTPEKQATHVFFDEKGNATSNSAATPPMTVFVDCKSLDYADSAEYFASILSSLGATTLRRWNWNPETQHTPTKLPRVGLTHVVFFAGAARTLKKVKQARKLGIDVKCVGLSWVMQCKQSERLTIGIEGHEIDVEAELLAYNNLRRKSMEPTALNLAVDVKDKSIALSPVDYLAPVKFGEEAGSECAASASDDCDESLVTPGSSSTITDFQRRQLALVRRNSDKFRPSISSPLSKKAWRG